MMRIPPIRIVVLTLAFAALPGLSANAQYSNYEPPRWHLNGFAGFDLTHTQQSQTNVSTFTNQLFPMGDLRLNGDGFLLDPKFLDISAAYEFQKGANQADRGDLALGGQNVAVNSAFLPKSHLPLRVSYMKTNHGVTGLGLDQNTDDSRLDVQWNVFEPKLPHIFTSFQDYSSTVHVPESFSDRTFDQKSFTVGLSDNWKGWQWSGNYSIAAGTSNGVSQLVLNSMFDNNLRSGGFNAQKSLMDNKAHLRFENREVWQEDHLAGDGSSNTSEMTNNATFDVQVHPKVMLTAGYAFTQLDSNNVSFTNPLGPGSAPVQLISLLASTSHSAVGRVDYHPVEWLRLSQDVRETFSTPVPGVTESETSFTDTASSVTAEHRWHRFDFLGSYIGRFQMADTTLDNTPTQWSNSGMGRIAWGDVRYLHVIATVEDQNLNLVEQIGGFTHQKRAALELETHRVKSFRLRASGDYMQVELLNISGDTRDKIVTYTGSAEHRLFTVVYSKIFSDGAGALFPLSLINPQFLVIPLPIDQLIATPLLDRRMNADTVTFLCKPRRRLEAAVSWRREEDQLQTSDQEYNILQADARYHLGKFTLEGGYSRNLFDVTNLTGPTGTRLAIWYFRIGRDFKVF
ncbi:MAG: hypothetical protein ACM3SW_11410 [Actinomycetota bacterium]